ncbi:CYTH domain-containing protein [Acidobacteriota bacterium]
MTTEIERKFVVHKLPPDLHKLTPKKIIQGYLSITEDGTEIRLRKLENAYFQTVKSGQGLKRQEIEIELSESQFSLLWPLTKGKRVEKTRYDIPYNNRIIELDIYKGSLKGLVTAEVEFKSQADAEIFAPPAWMDQEVTQDDRYKNRNLAVHGLPPKQLSNKAKL